MVVQRLLIMDLNSSREYASIEGNSLHLGEELGGSHVSTERVYETLLGGEFTYFLLCLSHLRK